MSSLQDIFAESASEPHVVVVTTTQQTVYKLALDADNNITGVVQAPNEFDANIRVQFSSEFERLASIPAESSDEFNSDLVVQQWISNYIISIGAVIKAQGIEEFHSEPLDGNNLIAKLNTPMNHEEFCIASAVEEDASTKELVHLTTFIDPELSEEFNFEKIFITIKEQLARSIASDVPNLITLASQADANLAIMLSQASGFKMSEIYRVLADNIADGHIVLTNQEGEELSRVPETVGSVSEAENDEEANIVADEPAETSETAENNGFEDAADNTTADNEAEDDSDTTDDSNAEAEEADADSDEADAHVGSENMGEHEDNEAENDDFEAADDETNEISVVSSENTESDENTVESEEAETVEDASNEPAEISETAEDNGFEAHDDNTEVNENNSRYVVPDLPDVPDFAHNYESDDTIVLNPQVEAPEANNNAENGENTVEPEEVVAEEPSETIPTEAPETSETAENGGFEAENTLTEATSEKNIPVTANVPPVDGAVFTQNDGAFLFVAQQTAFKTQFEQISKDIESLRNIVVSQQNKINSLNDLDQKLTDLRSQTSQLEATRGQIQADVNAHVEEVEDASKRLTGLEKRMSELNTQLSWYEQATDALRKAGLIN